MNSLDNNCNNEQSWWESLSNMYNSDRIQAYTPRWRQPCLTYHVADQCRLDKNIIDLIEQELMIINSFVQSLYQLYDTEYSQAQLVIQQATANIEIAACVIVYSTAIVQKRCVQIWRVNEDKPDYIIDMFSQAEDEQSQFICKEQHQFRKVGQKEDELLSEEAEIHLEDTYLPSSHTLSF
ncbi:28170_t:CDS:2, partial [Gigaspora margarita]